MDESLSDFTRVLHRYGYLTPYSYLILVSSNQL